MIASLADLADGPAAESRGRLAPVYSVVIPVYNSQDILPELVRRLDAFFAAHPYPYELIFVNDGSPDDSRRVLECLGAGRDDLLAVHLKRNCGQHSALLCGLAHARGDWVITMDDDLQNPPEEIAHLIRKADEGYDAVFGEFRQKMHGPARRLGSRLAGWLNALLFGKPLGLALTNFRILRREVVDALCRQRGRLPYIPGLVLLSARSLANVKVEHHPRTLGRSNYNALRLAQLVGRILLLGAKAWSRRS